MKINSIKKIGGLTLGLLLFLGITFVSSTTAQAQYWPNNQDYYRRQQREYERQQRERQRQLERQRRAQQQQQQQGGWYDQYGNYHPYNQGYYNNQGYNNQGYNNQGYYNRTQDNYSNYGGSYQSRQTALNAGYNEGVKAGRDDRRSGRYNPYGRSEYRNASKDYNSRYGDRASYAQYFREAFINGYADGYRGY